jgi:integrase/predicted nucleic acid-binding Zn ribbon protein
MEDTIYKRQSLEQGLKALASVVSKIKKSKVLTAQEKQDMLRFKDYKESEGKHPFTIEKNLRTLLLLREGNGRKKDGISKGVIAVPYHKLNADNADVFMPIVKDIEHLGLAQRTKSEYKKHLIAHVKFLNGMMRARPKGLEFVVVNTPKPFIDATKLLTFEDVKQAAIRERNPMMRALLWFAFETAARSSELVSIRIRDVSNADSELVHVRIPQTKTIAREFEIRDSKIALMEWLTVHPDRHNPEAPLFVKRRRNGQLEPLDIHDLRNYLSSSYRKDANGKRKNPRWIRKAGICDWIRRRGVDNPYMLMRIVGHEDINTAQAYIEFTGKQLNEYLRERYGLKPTEQLKDFNHCKLCGSLISPEATLCGNCNRPVTQTYEEQRQKDLLKFEDIERELEAIKQLIFERALNSAKDRSNVKP